MEFILGLNIVSFLSSFQTNQFTGMVYQTVLLAHRHSLRTGSLDDSVTPNTSPAQWPGIIYIYELFFLVLLELLSDKKQIGLILPIDYHC